MHIFKLEESNNYQVILINLHRHQVRAASIVYYIIWLQRNFTYFNILVEPNTFELF